MRGSVLAVFLYNLIVSIIQINGEPTFLEPIRNVTVVKGREAVLKCRVSSLAGYKVAWVRVDTQTILTIDSHVISRNVRISLIHSPEDENQWDLRITDVQESDRGWYLCQINTDPMKSTEGYLEVVVPPEIVDTGSSHDALVRDGESATFTCNASGYPLPTIKWKREDDKPMRIGDSSVSSVEGSTLHIPRVNRHHMGAYLCIASNGIRPSKSQRVELKVQFPPVIWIPNQLERAYVGQDEVTLRCQTEAFPDSINYWTNTDGTMLKPGLKYEIITNRSNHKVDMTLTIRNIEQFDIVTYLCVAKNSLGDSDGPIRLEEVEPPPPPPSQTMEYEEEIFPPEDFYTVDEDPLDKGGGVSPNGAINSQDTEATSSHNAIINDRDRLNSVAFDGTSNGGVSENGQKGQQKRNRRPKSKTTNGATTARAETTAFPGPSIQVLRLLLVVLFVVVVPNFLFTSVSRSASSTIRTSHSSALSSSPTGQSDFSFPDERLRHHSNSHPVAFRHDVMGVDTKRFSKSFQHSSQKSLE